MIEIAWLIYGVMSIATMWFGWNYASDTGKAELSRGVQPKWLLISEVVFCGIIWPLILPAVLSDCN